MELFGVTLLGINTETGHKLLLSLAVVGVAVGARIALGLLARFVLKQHAPRGWFWSRQAVSIGVVVFATVGLLSVWFDDTTKLAGFIGLFTAGIAFALQKVITSAAGYLLILRGKSFELGDRIQMGGVRGDVIGLGFLQTIIMEMGQTPAEQGDPPAQWVNGRQFTGRIVTVSNSAVFDEAVYNYTRDFPFLWDELTLPFPYDVDRTKAEQLMLDATRRHADELIQPARRALQRLKDRYYVEGGDLKPRTYWRLDEKYLSITVRFLTSDRDNREIKDTIGRELLQAFDREGIHIGAAT